MPHIEFTRKTPDAQELFYQGWTPQGEPKGVLCLVHGLGDHVGRYAHVGRALNDAGYVLLGFDQRGHGKTPGPKGVSPRFEVLLDDIGLLLEEAAKAFPAAANASFLYGHSMGGNFVLNYALRRRPGLAGVIATSPALRTAFKPPSAKVTAGKLLYQVAPNVAMPNGLDLAALSRDPAVVKAYRNDPLVHDRMSARLGLDIIQEGEWALAHAAEFPPVPLLLVHGSADRIASWQATEEFASKVQAAGHADGAAQGRAPCTLKIWPDYYHETHNEPERDQVLQYMISWLDGVGR